MDGVRKADIGIRSCESVYNRFNKQFKASFLLDTWEVY